MKNIFLMVKDVNVTSSENSNVIVVEGYANRYLDDSGQLIVDRSGDAVVPVGYNLENYMKNPIILAYHNSTLPVGKALDIKITNDGLKIVAEIHQELNRSVYYAVLNGILKSFSIGFKVIDSSYDDVTNIYYYKQVELLEVSLVTVPDNQDSLFSVLTSSPCGNGSCLLSSKASPKHVVEANKIIKNKTISMQKWSSVDKNKLLKDINDINLSEVTEEAYLIKRVNNKGKIELKFPHHDIVEGALCLNKEGVFSAYSALKSILTENKYTKEEKINSLVHLKKHYEEMKTQGIVEELPTDFEETLKNIEMSTTKENNDNVNTKENVESNNTTENPQQVIDKPKTEAEGDNEVEVTYELIESFIDNSTSENRDLNNLLNLYQKIEDKINAIIKI